ncbi:MAG: type II secretion system secretin GspD [Acidiferrobacterales bacterium]
MTNVKKPAALLLAGVVMTATMSMAPGAETQPGKVTTPPVTANPPTSNQNEVLFNFQAVDIQAVVKTVSKLTGRNFILDPRVKGKITIVSAQPVSRGAAYQIFLSALKAQGFTAVAGPGSVTKIVPVGEGKHNAATSARVQSRGGDQMVTRIIVVQHGSATQLVPLLRPLMAPTSQLSAYAPANALVITDYARNVRRLGRIIAKIDKPASTEVTVIPLKYASALDMADLITRLQTRGGSPAQKVAIATGAVASIIPDLRTNSLLVRTNNPGQLAQLKKLVAKLDVQAQSTGNTRVVYLRNAEAIKLVEVLRGLLKATPATKNTKSGFRKSFIQADEATNSLIINASDAVYNNLRSVIEKLDIRRAQVYVEALIAEVSSEDTFSLGFQWAGAGETGGGGIAGGMINFPGSGAGIGGAISDPGAIAGLSGLSLAYLGPEVIIGGQTVRGLGALANALEGAANANILSTPNILTLDNAEASIIVGQNVPFLTGSYSQAAGVGSTVNPFQTIERKDIGLTLRIKPQISEGGVIRLEIFQEVSNVSRTQVEGSSDLITNKRAINTTVVVDDGHTIVLGGLIQDTVESTQSKVPLLGSIPILGALFRYKSDKTVKKNLMVFLRPTIIRTRDDSYRLTSDRYDLLKLKSDQFIKEQRKEIDRLQPATQGEVPVAPESQDDRKKEVDSKKTEEPSTEF